MDGAEPPGIRPLPRRLQHAGTSLAQRPRGKKESASGLRLFRAPERRYRRVDFRSRSRSTKKSNRQIPDTPLPSYLERMVQARSRSRTGRQRHRRTETGRRRADELFERLRCRACSLCRNHPSRKARRPGRFPRYLTNKRRIRLAVLGPAPPYGESLAISKQRLPFSRSGLSTSTSSQFCRSPISAFVSA